ncbi:MAG TPA: phage terminase large subunit [Verrucomicrobiota bacterium]|nr:phage terminase large subunit [Verrucomicrobiota bacterium]
MTLRVDVHEAQQAFLDSEALYRGFVGGRGCGKSFVGALDLLLRAKDDRLYGVYAPTYPMLRDSSWRSFLDMAGQMRFIRKYNQTEMRVTLGNGAEVIFRSVDNPERARGPNLSGAWLDEASLMHQDAYTIIIACLREGGEQGWLSATFTPRGRQHWTYDTFGCGKPNTALFHAKTGDNPFLPSDFADTLRAQYPSQFAKQELEGEFVELAGNVFRRDWFRIVEAAPDGLRWVRYWDLAASVKESADYTASVACALGTDGVLYLRDMVRGKWEWPDQERIIVQTALAEPNTTHGIEKALHGIAALQTLMRRRDLLRTTIKGIDVDRDKLSRALPLSARAEQGKVVLVRGQWIPSFLDELTAFSGDGKTHDDQVDTASGGLAMLAGRPRKLVTW